MRSRLPSLVPLSPSPYLTRSSHTALPLNTWEPLHTMFGCGCGDDLLVQPIYCPADWYWLYSTDQSSFRPQRRQIYLETTMSHHTRVSQILEMYLQGLIAGPFQGCQADSHYQARAGFSRIKKIPYQAPLTQLGPQKCTFWKNAFLGPKYQC